MSVEEWVWLSALCRNCQALTRSGIASSGVDVAGNEAISVLVGQGLEPRSSWLFTSVLSTKGKPRFYAGVRQVGGGQPGVSRAETLLRGRRVSAGMCDRDRKRILHGLKTCPPPLLP